MSRHPGPACKPDQGNGIPRPQPETFWIKGCTTTPSGSTKLQFCNTLATKNRPVTTWHQLAATLLRTTVFYLQYIVTVGHSLGLQSC